MRDEQLLAYLKGSCSGRKNRVGGTELERTLHVSGTDLRKLVNQLRRKTQGKSSGGQEREPIPYPIYRPFQSRSHVPIQCWRIAIRHLS